MRGRVERHADAAAEAFALEARFAEPHELVPACRHERAREDRHEGEGQKRENGSGKTRRALGLLRAERPERGGDERDEDAAARDAQRGAVEDREGDEDARG